MLIQKEQVLVQPHVVVRQAPRQKVRLSVAQQGKRKRATELKTIEVSGQKKRSDLDTYRDKKNKSSSSDDNDSDSKDCDKSDATPTDDESDTNRNADKDIGVDHGTLVRSEFLRTFGSQIDQVSNHGFIKRQLFTLQGKFQIFFVEISNGGVQK